MRDPSDIFSILQVNNLGQGNAETVEVTSYDFQGNYSFGFDNLGDFRIGLQASYMAEFLYQEDPTRPVIDGAGQYNDLTDAAPELPEWRINLTLGWNRGGHSVTGIVRYVDSLPYDGPAFSHLDFFGGFNRPGNIFETGVKAWTDMDVTYTYRGLELFGGEAAFSFGARNLFDREAQNSPEFAGVIGGLQDPRGRVVFGRVVYDF